MRAMGLHSQNTGQFSFKLTDILGFHHAGIETIPVSNCARQKTVSPTVWPATDSTIRFAVASGSRVRRVKEARKRESSEAMLDSIEHN